MQETLHVSTHVSRKTEISYTEKGVVSQKDHKEPKRSNGTKEKHSNANFVSKSHFDNSAIRKSKCVYVLE